MGAQAKMYEEWAIAATVDPVDANNTDTDSDEVDMSKFSEILIVVLLGVLNDSATDAIVVKDSPTSGGSFTAISGKSKDIVGTDDAKQFLISVRSDELNAGARYLKVTQNNSAHSQLMAIVVLAKPIYGPATDHDLSTVGTVVDLNLSHAGRATPHVPDSRERPALLSPVSRTRKRRTRKTRRLRVRLTKPTKESIPMKSTFQTTTGEGGMSAILADQRFAPGAVWFVQSTHANAGDTAGRGQTPDAPFATIDYAVGKCTAAKGDLIVVLPGHVETVSAANGLDYDVADIRVIGVGNRGSRPKINFTATTATARINANNVHLQNLLFTGGIDAVAVMLVVNGKTDITLLDLEFRDVTGTATKFLHAANNSDRLLIDGLTILGAGATNNAKGATFDGCDDLHLKNFKVIGAFSTAAIEFITTLSARVQVHDGRIWNQNSADVCILDTITGSTGQIGPNITCTLTDNAANITEAVTGATFHVHLPISVVNAFNEASLNINWTASTDA